MSKGICYSCVGLVLPTAEDYPFCLAMPPRLLHLVRHAQGEHNATKDYTLPDPLLTKLGIEQSLALHRQTKETIQKSADGIICSPLRRTMQTALVAFPELIGRLNEKKRSKVDARWAWPLLDPLLQEIGHNGI